MSKNSVRVFLSVAITICFVTIIGMLLWRPPEENASTIIILKVFVGCVFFSVASYYFADKG